VHYRDRRFADALAQIGACRTADAKGELSAYFDVMEARCRAFLAAPPPDDWDGVYVAESK
jgi:adenylate cyclase